MKIYEERIEKRSIEYVGTVPGVPKYYVGQIAEVYNGEWEGHQFRIADVRWHVNRKRFEYLRKWVIGEDSWHGEDDIILLR